MATPRSKEEGLSLETQPWNVFSIGCKNFLIKGVFSVDSYSILATDFGAVWEEALKEVDVVRRWKRLNPLVEVPAHTILKNLASGMKEQLASCQYTIKKSNEKEFILTFEGPLQDGNGLNYQWEFSCLQAPSAVLDYHLVGPLLSANAELVRREKELILLLAKKDKEIQDYQEQGATVSRKHLKTAPFDEKVFDDEMIASDGFKHVAASPQLVFKNSKYQKLFKDICSYRESMSFAEDTPTETSPMATLSTKSVPFPSTTPPSSSPSKSPQKKSLQDEKDEETSRRAQLQKQLEDSKLKSKKKRRRLM